MAKAEYRSAKRSRTLIKNAFVELLLEKDISQITVQNIAETADINRGTFYAHYRDVYDVLEQIENELIEAIDQMLDDFQRQDLIRNPLEILLAIANYLEDDAEFNKRLLQSRGANTLLLKLRKLIMQRIASDKMLLLHIKNPVELQLCASYIAAGGVGVLQDRFNSDMTVPLRSVATIMDRLMWRGMEDFLKG